MKRTPWFKYKDYQPMRDGDYEIRCAYVGFEEDIKLVRWETCMFPFKENGYPVDWLDSGCEHCQWRGLTTKDGK